jgi:hypothetical protein
MADFVSSTETEKYATYDNNHKKRKHFLILCHVFGALRHSLLLVDLLRLKQFLNALCAVTLKDAIKSHVSRRDIRQ